MTSPMHTLSVKIYADGADLPGMLELNANPLIRGLTTNPTLMRKAGITDYESFAHEVLAEVTEKPVSFEVFADEFPEMRRQALQIASWAENVYVKIPVFNPRGESATELIRELAGAGVKLNVTALMTEQHVAAVASALEAEVPAVVSIFAGRIADTGRDPLPVFTMARRLLSSRPRAEILWASVREVFNIFQSDSVGCDIVTVGHDILRKAMEMAGKNLDELAVDTVRMFDRDAKSAAFTLRTVADFAEPQPLGPLKVAA